MSSINRSWSPVVVAACSWVFMSRFAAAAPADDSATSATLEDVVVTARKRTENLQDTPVAISAFTSEMLEERNVETIGEVGRFAPNVQFDSTANESSAGGTSQISIRGVGQTDYVITVEPGVGLYMDGVYIGANAGGLIDNVDIAGIEVLRGPQGTLFGKNTIGGAISVTSLRPTATPTMSAEATVGSFDRRDLKASVSGPLTDRIRVRLTAASQNRDGYLTSYETGQTEGSQKRLFARLVAEIDLTDNLLATISGDVTHVNEEQAATELLNVNESGYFPGLHNTVKFPACAPGGSSARFSNPNCFNSQWVTPLNSLRNYGIGPNHSEYTVTGTHVTMDWKGAPFELKSISAYRKVAVNTATDLAPNPSYVDYDFQHIAVRSVSQEFQLIGNAIDGRFRYVAGLYAFNQEGTEVFPVIFDAVTITSGGEIENTSAAAYSQVSFDITPQLSLTAGGRLTHENIRFRPEQTIDAVSLPIVAQEIPTLVPGTPILPRVWVASQEHNFSPSATLSYKFNDATLAYFTFSRGFKAGGYTMRAFPPVIPGVTTAITDPKAVIPPYGPERVDQFEVGVKNELFDKRLRLNVAAFLSNYTDLQLLAATGLGGLVPEIFNAGSAQIGGAEVETEFVATAKTRLDASIGWLHDKYVRLDQNVAGITLSNKLPNAPAWTTHLGATQDILSREWGRVFVRGDWSFKSDQYKDAVNSPYLHQGSYSIVDAAVTWESASRGWSATVGGTNLTDKIYIVSGTYSDGTGISSVNPSPPREWFARVKHTF